MLEQGELETAHSKESAHTVHGWFPGEQSIEAYDALLEDEEADVSADYSDLSYEEEKPIEYTRRSYFRWPHVDVRRIFWASVPSFLAHAFGHGDEDSIVPDSTATSYLNGLRGIAAIIVVIMHNTDDFPFIHRGWGETEVDHYIIQLPFFRLIHCGIFSVCIFFVISGFALTYGPLKKAHSGQVETSVGTLPSSVFRRPIRLFLPVVPVIFVTLALKTFGLYYNVYSRGVEGPPATGIWGHLAMAWKTLMIIVTQSTTGSILPQAWTLSVEYKGSLLVFLCCLALGRVSPLVRLSVVMTLFVWFWTLGADGNMWQPCLFLWGMILADVRHVRDKLPNLTGSLDRAAAASWWPVFVFAIFLGGYPINGNTFAATGYWWLAYIPVFGQDPARSFPSVAAMILVTALENLPLLQRGLNARWVLYLGEISYGVYLVHWAAERCFLTMGLKYKMLNAGYSIGVAWTLTFVLGLVLSVWFGDVHWRMVDQKSVRFARWLTKTLGV
ncbi:acyltransferase [Colletotrichum orchidophilum]|uniref:Acyltransferase n=1 Tax=Colletotrichum orchidophilum TaxID=1209926 RepID=A0A1G4B552_9PEZI|nr:acyltransferase [Colletotrichum orchidophilum]OHE96568.1 acyltransferase [Colletotrichum orchidophilum]